MQAEEIHFNNAKAAFDYLSPAHGKFPDGISSRRWLFRGLPNSDYELLPTALRKGSIDQLNTLAGRVGLPGHMSTALQIYYEFNVLAKFYAEVDALGLPVADDAPELRPFLHRPRAWALTYLQSLLESGDTWPPKTIRGLAALAQHHGLPTRLLDWSLDPYVACYFACNSTGAGAEHIAIWAIDSFAVERSGGAVELVTAPAASNPNLHAQKGIFTVSSIHLAPETAFSEPEFFPVDQYLSHVNPLGDSIIYKILIPRSEVSALRIMVNRSGYKASTLFPGYEGAAKSVFETDRPAGWPTERWESRVTLIIPEGKQDIANAAASLLDPDTGGHRTFAHAVLYKDGKRYFVASGACPDNATPLIRQIGESIQGTTFFFQRAKSEVLVDTNSALPLGVSRSPSDLIMDAGFKREEQ